MMSRITRKHTDNWQSGRFYLELGLALRDAAGRWRCKAFVDLVQTYGPCVTVQKLRRGPATRDTILCIVVYFVDLEIDFLLRLEI